VSDPKKPAAVVTGAGSGIGQAIAVVLAKHGLNVVIVGRDAGKLDQTKAKIAAAAPNAHTLAVSCDVANRDDVAALAEKVAGFSDKVDVLVCNAGTNVRDRSLAKLSLEDWDKMINTNLTGSFNLVHVFLPGMRERKNGLIVQICSVSGLRASVLGGAGYSASKFGQAALGICIGREDGPNGIRSTVIYPGEVNTPILDARPVPVAQERKMAILQPEDVAAAVKFLVELHPRASVPELVIKPTVDDFC
jgi:NADP-dependent 3-hydroxy acid dehydrogenase YdfG